MTEPGPNITQRDYLRLMEKNADERHEAVMDAIERISSDLEALKGRTANLETVNNKRVAVTNVSNKVWGAAAACGILIINIPAALIAMRGL